MLHLKSLLFDSIREYQMVQTNNLLQGSELLNQKNAVWYIKIYDWRLKYINAKCVLVSYQRLLYKRIISSNTLQFAFVEWQVVGRTVSGLRLKEYHMIKKIRMHRNIDLSEEIKISTRMQHVVHFEAPDSHKKVIFLCKARLNHHQDSRRTCQFSCPTGLTESK